MSRGLAKEGAVHLCRAILLLLVGCNPPEEGPFRIATGDSGPGLVPHRQILAQLQSRYPEQRLRLEPISGGDYYTRLLTQLASGSTPDLMQIGDDAVGLFARRECLAPLPEPDSGAYYPALLEPGRVDGKLYALPKDYTTLAVYINLRLFREGGVSPPAGNWDLDEFLRLARLLTRGQQCGLVLPAVRGATLEWLTMLLGGQLFDPERQAYSGALDGPACIEAMALLASLYDEGVTPLPGELGSYQGGITDFEDGRAAMKVGGHWELASLRSNPRVELAVFPLPAHRGRRVNLLHWAGLAAAVHSPHREKAIEILQAYSGPLGSRAFAGWALPASPAIAEETGLTSDPLEKVWLDELMFVRPRAYTLDPFWSQVGAPAVTRLHEAIVVDPDLDIRAFAARVAAEADSLRRQRQKELALIRQ